MEIKVYDKESKYFKWFQETAVILKNMLNNRLIFERKIELVKIFLIEAEKTEGEMSAVKGEDFKIMLKINPNDDERIIRFVMGHELTHLLFASIHKLYLADYSDTDDSFAISNVKRKTESEVYGSGMEEMLCDYISLEILYRVFNKKYTHEELIKFLYSMEYEGFSEKNYYLIKQIVSIFGTDLKDREEIDSYSKDDYGMTPDNILLYTVATNSLSILMHEYDGCMGAGSWRRFNKAFDEFVLDNSNMQAMRVIEMELERYKYIEKEL